MKFLNLPPNIKNVMPLNIYYNNGSQMAYNDDFIDIVYKDMDTGQKHVETIENPCIEVWILKEEFRTFNYIKNFIRQDHCYPVTVHYKTRFFELAKLMKEDVKNIKYSPYLSGIDVQIEHFYMIRFIEEYGNTLPKNLSIGYLDIEADVITLNRFPEPGEVPINAVTYIDGFNKQVYTLVLTTSSLPKVNESHKNYKEFNEYITALETQISDVKNNISSFISDCHKNFDESYGELEYNIIFFDDERDLIKTLFDIIRACCNDFVFIWHMQFDIQYIIARIIELGMSPEDIIIDKVFKNHNGKFNREVFFKEDNNAVVNKRKHKCVLYTLQTYVCMMVLYAGIRAPKGKLPSNKLNYVAKRELKDSKLDYSEEGGEMKTFPYRNFIKFLKYGIKDVLLMLGINVKTRDSDTMYATMYANAVLSSEIFTSTTVLQNSLKMFINNYKQKYVLGSNRHKLYPNQITDYEKLLSELICNDENDQIEDDDDSDTEDFYDISDYETDRMAPTDKKDKFKGAFVMSLQHMTTSGFEIMGTKNKYIHDFVIDVDVTAEYPTAIMITNCSNDTLIGKILFEEPSSITIPIYPEFNFTPDEKKSYKIDIGGFLMETYAQNDIFDLANIFLNIPSISTILDDIDLQIEDFIEEN